MSGPPRPIEAHPFNARGWNVEFVEELPAWGSIGVQTIGVRVTVPENARQALITQVTAGIFHTRNEEQLFYSHSFGIVPKRSVLTRTRRKSYLNAKGF